MSGTVNLDGACNIAFAYGIPQESMITGEYVGWFVDADNSTSTGSQSGFRGADFALGRLASGFASLSRYNASTATFQQVKQIQPSGAFGVQLHLSDFDVAPGTFTVAGGASWKSSSTGSSYHDFAPNVGLSPVPVAVNFSSAAPPPPPPPPAPVPNPAPVTATQPQQQAPVADCKMPRLKGLTLAQTRNRLRLELRARQGDEEEEPATGGPCAPLRAGRRQHPR